MEYELLQKTPGIKEESAAVILGEIGPNVEAFESAGHLASCAGLSPGSYESAGKRRSSRTTRGNKYLKSALVTSGGIAGNSEIGHSVINITSFSNGRARNYSRE